MREGTPTIYWVEGGKKQFEYIGQRAQQDIINFVKKLVSVWTFDFLSVNKVLQIENVIKCN